MDRQNQFTTDEFLLSVAYHSFFTKDTDILYTITYNNVWRRSIEYCSKTGLIKIKHVHIEGQDITVSYWLTEQGVAIISAKLEL